MGTCFVLCFGSINKNILIEYIGRPTACGTEIVINIPNPFDEQFPWIIVIQVKNYKGEIGVEVAEQ